MDQMIGQEGIHTNQIKELLLLHIESIKGKKSIKNKSNDKEHCKEGWKS